jgi:hypothetical protein
LINAQLQSKATDPYQRLSEHRWRSLRAEVRPAIKAQERARTEAFNALIRGTLAEQSQADIELLARTRTLLDGWELPTEATSTRELFDVHFRSMDTNRAKIENRRLAFATHPDHGGDQEIFGHITAAYADYRQRMQV